VHVPVARLGAALLLCAVALLAPATLPPVAQAAGPEVVLDNRGWEMVSPAEKNGGEVATPSEAGAGAFQAAAQGGGIAFASAASFGDAEGAAPFSQYLSFRGADSWSTQNITPPHLSGAYDGDPYVAHSADLARSLYLNPARCPAGDPCPAGYQLRTNLTGALVPSPDDPGLFAGASPDLLHIVFLRGSDLFLWSPPSATLTRVNDVSAAGLAAPEDAVSTDGARIYWRGALDGNLRLWEGGAGVPIDTAAGGGGDFAAASADGSVAFFTKANHLYRFAVGNPLADDLTPLGDVTSVLGASADGSRLFFTTSIGLHIWRQGLGAQQIATGGPTLSDLSPDTAAPTADGARLFFTTARALVVSDTNSASDAYQWSDFGTGGCARVSGCLGLLSSGRTGNATFLDASADGADAYFLTNVSLVGADPGSVDIYDARVDGGFPEPSTPTPCVADACQGPPPEPEAVTPTSVLFAGRGNGATPAQERKQAALRRCKQRERAKGKRGNVKRCARSKAKGKRNGGRR
jgi:hypothetical protein